MRAAESVSLPAGAGYRLPLQWFAAEAAAATVVVMPAVEAVEMVVVAKIHFQLPNQTKQNHILLGLIYQMTLNFYQVHLELIDR